MKRRPGGGRSTKASSIQIGFVLNAGIMTTFIAVMLVVIGGGIEDTDTRAELESVSDEVTGNLIQADTLVRTEGDGGFTAFFEPPSSGADYTATIEENGGDVEMTLTASDGSLVDRNLDSLLDADVVISGGSEIEFDSGDENVVVEGEEISPGNYEIRLSVQKATGNRST